MDEMKKTQERSWPQIRAVLEQVLDLAPQDRSAAVAAICEHDAQLRLRVLSVLEAYPEGETEEFERPDFGDRGDGSASAVGEEIGAYRIVARLGEGGMGTVYLARRSDDAFTRNVAIKLLRRRWASAEELRRFRSERQILADLEHPSIARLLDGGKTAEGRPYLVMEYVEGERIDSWCRRRELGLEQILELFLQVCDAVQFAHQRLIVHRDLKPSNILVTEEGIVKLLDFGIAKVLATENFAATVLTTRDGVTPMTPGYASPEQVRGQAITTATDVYALGMLLHLLLTGDLPYRVESGDLSALVEAVCHREAAAPSSRVGAGTAVGIAASRLRGDLDAIVLKALAKDPARRFASAEQMADDLRRYLARQPIRARKGSFLYRTGKFFSRYRTGLIAAGVVFVTMAMSLFVLLSQQESLVAERNRALHERQLARSVTGYLVELFELPDPGLSLGESVTARELLDKASGSVQEDLAAEPELQAELLGVLGRTYASLGLLSKADELTGSALDLTRERSRSSDPGPGVGGLAPDAAEALPSLILQRADIVGRRGHYREALEWARKAEGHIVEHLGPGHAMLAESQLEQAFWLTRLGQFQDAAELFERAIAGVRSSGDRDNLAHALTLSAELSVEVGELERALESYREARELRIVAEGPEHPDVNFLDSNMAAIEARRLVNRGGNAEELAQGLEEIIERQRALYDGAHPVLATALNNLALIWLDLGDLGRAEKLLDESIDMKRQVLGPSHPKIAAALANRGLLERKRGRFTEAEQAYGRALGILDRELGANHPDRALCLANLGNVQMALGRLDDARGSLEEALGTLFESLGPSHERTLAVRNNLGEVMRRLGQPQQAREYFLKAVSDSQVGPGGENSSRLASFLFNLAAVELQLDDKESATKRYERILELVGEDDLIGHYALAHLARLRLDAERWREAATFAERAESGFADQPRHLGWYLSARRSRARALLEVGQVEEAIEIFRDRLERLGETAEPGSQRLKTAEEDLAGAIARALSGGNAPNARAEAKARQ